MDAKDAINTGRGYDAEKIRINHCITGVKNNLHKRHQDATNKTNKEFRITKSKFKNWRHEQIIDFEKKYDEEIMQQNMKNFK